MTLAVIDDNKGVLEAVKTATRRQFDKIITLSNPEGIPAMLREDRPDVVLLDMNFRTSINSGNEGIYWLREIRRLLPSARVVLFTAYADVALAVRGMKEGAVDFLVKPFENEQLLSVLRSAISPTKKTPTPKATPSPMIWGATPAMEKLRSTVERIAATGANVLITGENGTGKEVLAREIHALSARSAGPMVTVDMGSITETLFESELFGHAKGAFTDAKAERVGKFEEAEGGTLFLDEIGNLPLHLQAKLLTALQQRRIVRVGSNRPIDIDLRLVCATNRNLPQMVGQGEFREDLLYRINTIHLELPPLRERAADIPTFARAFVDKYASAYGKGEMTLEADAALKLSQYPWPGNIRELQHAVEKAVIMAERPNLRAADFDLPRPEASTPDSGPMAMEGQTLEDMERQMISQALKACDGNLSKAAQQLGITRQTLYNKLKRYEI